MGDHRGRSSRANFITRLLMRFNRKKTDARSMTGMADNRRLVDLRCGTIRFRRQMA